MPGDILSPEELKLIRDQTKTEVDRLDASFKAAIAEAKVEMKTIGTVANDTMTKLDDVSRKLMPLTDRLVAVEQKLAAPRQDPNVAGDTPGEAFLKSDAWKAAKDSGRADSTGKISVGKSWGFDQKAAIVNATGQNQPLVPAMRLPFLMPIERELRIRDLLPVGETSSNALEYAKENVFTNAAAAIGSPYENVAKPESGITFVLATAIVRTIAHWIPASRQVLDDAPALQSYIDQRLRYGLKFVEEDEILNGNNTGAHLNGLVTQATDYNTAFNSTGDNKMDTVRHAIMQAELADLPCDGMVLNPQDWHDMEVSKDDVGDYLIGDPKAMLGKTLWGRPVVTTNSMTVDTFLTGAFQLGAQLWDRMEATVEIARQHSDFFVKNMVAILCEERIALTVYRPQAFINGSFP